MPATIGMGVGATWSVQLLCRRLPQAVGSNPTPRGYVGQIGYTNIPQITMIGMRLNETN